MQPAAIVSTTKKEAAMGTEKDRNQREGRFVRANGIDIHYVETGAGKPLILLTNGMISMNPIWAEWPSSYARYIPKLELVEPSMYTPMPGCDPVEPVWKGFDEFKDVVHPRQPTARGEAGSE